MYKEITKEIELRLKAPMIALEKISKEKYLPNVFAQAALDELRKVQQLINKLNEKKGRISV